MSLSDELGLRLASARNAARSGQYQLLLGAGASVGARTASGPVPDAEGLVNRLAAKYPEGRIDTGTRLPRAYQRAVQAGSANDVWWFLRDLFGNATHERWFTDLASMPWRRVWTLNIDDAFEHAYQKSARRDHANLKVIDWVDEYVEPVGPEIIHLHGQVAGTTPSPIVFSMSEYHAAAEAHGVWHKVLRGVLASEPVVIVGARILDDLDVETLVLSARPRSFAPSIVVDPFISDSNTWELSNAGFLVVRETGAKWLEEWTELFGLDGQNLAELYESAAVNLPQITELLTDRVVPAPASHDLFGGSEPLWSDACQGFIAQFEWMNEITTHIREWAAIASAGVFVRVAYVNRLAGGTAGLLGIAHAVRLAGVRVLRFDRSVRFNPQRLHDMCRGLGPVLLIIDGGYAFADDVQRLAQLAHDLGEAQLYILVGERPQRASLVEDHLAPGNYPIEVQRISLRRSFKDAQAIEGVLHQQGRLGQLEETSLNNRVQHFYKRDIFSALSDVEHAAGFRARLDKEVNQLSTKWHRDLVVLLALVSEGGVQVSLTEAGFALDTPVDSILSAVNDSDHLGALIEVDGDLLLARHRMYAIDSLISIGGGVVFLESLGKMLQRMAELIPQKARTFRTRGSLLVAHLMSAKMLHSVFPNADVDVLYQRVLPQYGEWNARYWEQRSIYARITDEWDPAVSFAERAVTIHDDTFTRNTLAVNLLSKATNLASRDDPGWREYYAKGLQEFDKACGRERSASVSRWARLTSTLALISALADRLDRDLLREKVEDVLDDWSTAYSEYRIALPRIQGSESVLEAERLSRRFAELEAKVSSAIGSAETNTEAENLQREEAIRTAIRQVVTSLTLPMPLAKVAAAVSVLLTADLRADWGGYRTFKRALLSALPEAVISPENAGTLQGAALTVPESQSVSVHEKRSESSDQLLAVLRRLALQLDRPTNLASLATSAVREVGIRGKHDWAGYGTLKRALRQVVPGVEITAQGYVLPPLVSDDEP